MTLKSVLITLSLATFFQAAHADGINDAMIQNLTIQRDQAQRNADREASYGHRDQAYKWQQVADQIQSQIDGARTRGNAIDDAARQLTDALQNHGD